MNEMVVRVAEAICDDREGGGTWESLTEDERATWYDTAFFAVRAMREPTEAMARAALDADLDIYWAYRSDERDGGPEGVWEIMIDEALAETPPTEERSE